MVLQGRQAGMRKSHLNLKKLTDLTVSQAYPTVRPMSLFNFGPNKSRNLTSEGIENPPRHRPPLVGVVLAAGRGSRFDPSGRRSKLTQAVDGVPMLGMTISSLSEVLDEVIVVLRDDRHRHELEQLTDIFGAKSVLCPDASSGMGHSLAWGISYVNAHYNCTGVLITLGDMPYVSTRSVTQLAGQIRKPSDIAALRFDGRIGHPVGFGSDYFASLGRLTGDQGAKKILEQHKTVMIDTHDAGVLQDIDSPSDIRSD